MRDYLPKGLGYVLGGLVGIVLVAFLLLAVFMVALVPVGLVVVTVIAAPLVLVVGVVLWSAGLVKRGWRSLLR